MAVQFKLVLIAGFAATATLAARRTGMAPIWVIVPLLPIGGAAFLVDNAVLTALLTASLPLLLVWAAAISIAVARRAH